VDASATDERLQGIIAFAQRRPRQHEQAALHGGSSPARPQAFNPEHSQAQTGQTPGHSVQGGEPPRPAPLPLQDLAALTRPTGVGDLHRPAVGGVVVVDLNVAHHTRLDQHLQLGNLHPSSLVY
jgi:hypothetical protein